MTLTDIEALRQEMTGCAAPQEVLHLLEDSGEDGEQTDAEGIFHRLKLPDSQNGFVWQEHQALLGQTVIRCPKCGNESPATILSSASDLLQGNLQTPFGCCECGTRFTIA